MLARARGVPMPRAAFLSAMASPDLAEEARPWRRQAELPEERFKACAAVPALGNKGVNGEWVENSRAVLVRFRGQVREAVGVWRCVRGAKVRAGVCMDL